MIKERYLAVRGRSEELCSGLRPEDHVPQLIIDISPPKWHLAHTTWFFETLILAEFYPNYEPFNKDYAYLFNSYYESLGERTLRDHRGDLSRPLVEEVYEYRRHTDRYVAQLLDSDHERMDEIHTMIEHGLQHEQQHQELLVTDIKYIFGHNPIFPPLEIDVKTNGLVRDRNFMEVPEGIYEVGHSGDGFAFDNESGRHKVYLGQFAIADALVTNGEFMEFMKDGGYRNFQHWHAEGWDWVKKNDIRAPEYWHEVDGDWHRYDFDGLKPVDPDGVLVHISFFEAWAFADWKGMRLPTEFEWEVASDRFNWGSRWEWTNSAYLPYPGYKRPEGAIGEYNGKFMINQMVLRGGSDATPEGHSRKTYRNFFHPQLRWQYTGIRLAK